MAKKQAIVNETVRPAKAAPRVKAAKHRAVPAENTSGIPNETPFENVRDIVAVTAYGYWESRGRQGGDPMEDWLRAETEVHQRLR
jgi:hypothetical protein